MLRPNICVQKKKNPKQSRHYYCKFVVEDLYLGYQWKKNSPGWFDFIKTMVAKHLILCPQDLEF